MSRPERYAAQNLRVHFRIMKLQALKRITRANMIAAVNQKGIGFAIGLKWPAFVPTYPSLRS